MEAFILDMDGVVTRTATLHARAWKRMFDEFLEGVDGEGEYDLTPFDEVEDYLRYVDGKPRYRGAEDFLLSRGIELPAGSPEDPPGTDTVHALGNAKNLYFHELLEESGAESIGPTLTFIGKMRKRGKRFAVISSSRNATEILESAGVEELFDVVLGGKRADRLELPGKPEPDIFIEAAERLGVDARRAAVVEDSRAGIKAAVSGGFGLVIGLGSGKQAEELSEMGADIVVASLDRLIENGGPREDGGAGIPNAMDGLESILALLDGGEAALFLDYDGTLSPIVKRPEDAVLPPETREVLRKISTLWPVAVVSGRGLEDVMGMVGLDGIVYAGSHGFEISGMDIGLPGDIDPESLMEALDSAAEELDEPIGRVEGARIERKRFALAIHFRESPPGCEEELRQAAEAAADTRPELKVSRGKKIFELRPDVDWDKGRALRALLEGMHEGGSKAVPIYIGDDTTDEDAFREISGRGAGILVTDSPEPSTEASYLLRDTDQVAEFLGKLLEYAEDTYRRSDWNLVYDNYRPETEQLRETLCATGNGYFVTRGAAPECDAGEHHYPGTYIGGCYNRRVSHVSGRNVENESIVNAPNWLPLAFRIGSGDWIVPDGPGMTGYKQELDMSRGVLRREMEFTDGSERSVSVSHRRFCSMADRHMAAMSMEIGAKNWKDEVTLISSLDADVCNAQVKRYQQLDNHHLETMVQGNDGRELLWVQVRTNQSKVLISEAVRTRLFLNGRRIDPDRTDVSEEGRPAQRITVRMHPGDRLRVEKVASIFTSRDNGISESLLEARNAAADAGTVGEMEEDHVLGWQRLWNRCQIETDSRKNEVGRILNLHIFHLLQTVSPHSIGNDVGVPPRGLHGEAYRGLIMWDELFIFPFLDLRIPDLTRTLILYRYRRIRAARKAAEEAGYKGIMFPWQSGSNGREEAQTLHLNPSSGNWIPDNSQLQRHINIAVAYNVWKHFEVTDDIDFLSFYGSEMLVGIARFWASIARFNSGRERWEIHRVMGPDEFHDGYPDEKEPGLRNNAYTNVMTAWVMKRTLEALQRIPPDRRTALWNKLALNEEELENWRDMTRRMYVPFHGDGIISQFEGYDDLEEFDWEGYASKYGDIHRLDRILEAEGDTPNRYKVSKQADVLMLFYLLSCEELEEMFQDLGYDFDSGTIVRNVEYYLQRTAHGSTLSRIVHSWVLARSRRKESWELFREALNSDVADIQGGTTHEGIHLGAMAGTVDLVQRCYTGLETRKGMLLFNPNLPDELDRIEFNIRYRRNWIRVRITQDKLVVSSRECHASPVKVRTPDAEKVMEPGGTLEFTLR